MPTSFGSSNIMRGLKFKPVTLRLLKFNLNIRLKYYIMPPKIQQSCSQVSALVILVMLRHSWSFFNSLINEVDEEGRGREDS